MSGGYGESSSSSKRFQDADDDDYFMKPASASAMKDDENSWASPSNPFISSDFSSGGRPWFDNGDWLQPAYTEVAAEPGSILEGSKIALRRAGRSHVSRRGVFHADELCQAKSG